jgi:DNA-binding XRE family transcriptional regulator
MTPYERLHEWRTSVANHGAGISQEDAGALVAVSQATWSAWETGSKEPRIKNAVAIERATNGYVPVTMWLPQEAA